MRLVSRADIGTVWDNFEGVRPGICDQVINERRRRAGSFETVWHDSVVRADKVGAPMREDELALGVDPADAYDVSASLTVIFFLNCDLTHADFR